MENRAYEIRIVKSKTDLTHKDLTKALTAKQTDPTRPAGQYFICELLAQKEMFKGVMQRPQTGRIPLILFNSSNQKTKFDDLVEALSDEKNYETISTGEIVIHPSVMGVAGRYLSMPTPGNQMYEMRNPDGKPLLVTSGPDKGKPRTRNEVKFFVFDDENEDVRYAQELARIPADAWVKPTDDGTEE